MATNLAIPTNSSPVAAYWGGVAVTPSDTENLPQATLAVWVGGTGALSFIPNNQTTALTLSAVPAGTLLHISASRINATGTTATNIVALW